MQKNAAWRGRLRPGRQCMRVHAARCAGWFPHRGGGEGEGMRAAACVAWQGPTVASPPVGGCVLPPGDKHHHSSRRHTPSINHGSPAFTRPPRPHLALRLQAQATPSCSPPAPLPVWASSACRRSCPASCLPQSSATRSTMQSATSWVRGLERFCQWVFGLQV
jgi:hypothetical protein